MNIYRQGDLLIKQIDKLPENLKKIKDNIIAIGEATGHKHQLLERETTQFEILEDEKGNKFLNIKQPTDLIHEEHKMITIEKGIYFIKHEREYDYFGEELRRISD